MDKQELIERIEDFPCEASLVTEMIRINKNTRLGWVKELDEPQKVKVPQFVADWIEEGKKHCKDVFDLLDFDFTNKEVGNWFLQEKPVDLVARAWLDGYEIEKEKRYRVSLKNGQPLLKAFLGNNLYFSQDIAIERYEVTHKELEQAGFGWVFDCPGIEIEEVKE